MKKLFLLLAPLTLGLMVGCSYDDSAILDKIAEMEKEHDEMQAQIDAQQKLLDALANKLTITDVIQTSNGYTITLSDGTSMTIKDGEPGDNFIESIVVGEEDVTFTLTDGTVIVIPLGCSSSGSGDTLAENNKIYYTTSDNTKLFPITDASLYGAILISNTYKDGQGVLVFDDAVTKIGGDAFAYCESLTSVTIPDSVTEIWEWAFDGCSSLIEFKGKFASEDGRCLIIDGTLNHFAPAGLTEYTIPDSVTMIGGSAFENCTSLTSVTIGDSVTKIGERACYECSRLTGVYCKAITPPAGDSYMFANNALGRKIYVPMESVKAYKSASSWSEYASDIVGYDFENGVVVTPEPANNEIWYTNGSTTEATTPYNTNLFGANIVSNTYDAAKECWVIKFDGEVTAIGDWAFSSCDSLTSVTTGDSVTTIGGAAFADCWSLTSVTIPDSVTTIGDEAFSHCSSLTSVYISDIAAWCNISFSGSDSNPLSNGCNLYLNYELVTDLTIPDSVTTIGYAAFSGCRSLRSVTIPDSVTTIGDIAFLHCSSLTSVTVGDSITTIGDGAFEDCSSLTSVTIGASVTTIGNGAFQYCCSLTSVTIPDSVTTIGDEAFAYCSSLTSVTIPDSVTTIGEAAFRDCSSLTSVTIPDSVTTIGESAFANCSSLQEFNGKFASEDSRCLIIDGVLNSFAIGCGATEYIIPDSVTAIGDWAFSSCDSLTSVTIGDSVTEIGDDAFRDCSSLTSVTIPDSVTTIGYWAFLGCSSLTSVTIPDSVTTIGVYAFSSCHSLTSVTIPDSVTTIGDGAFEDCSSLTSVTIPDSVTTIGDGAFEDCSSLTSVTIGASVTTIGKYTFYDCSSLTSVYCKAITPPAGDSYMFYSNASGRKIYVPTESVEAYRSASYWRNYASDIVGYNF